MPGIETVDGDGYTLDNVGLAINRALEPGVADPLRTDVRSEFGDAVCLRPFFNLNLLDYDDVRAQKPLRNVLASTAKEKLKERVGSLAVPRDIEVEEVALVRGRTIVANFTQEIEDEFLAERSEITHELEKLGLEHGRGRFDWRNKIPALVMGTVDWKTSNKTKDRVVELIEGHLFGRPLVGAAEIMQGQPVKH